jgi:2-(1,2-epoxy-1,2-dihydrophenyl)acetyl-CoA isomerase
VIERLVTQLYEALAAGDADALERFLSPGFRGDVTAGMPPNAGGMHEGAGAMRDNAWWTIGRAFAVRPVADEMVPCADGRLLVRGRYVGRARSTGQDFDARFAHLWTADNGRLTSVWQVADTTVMAQALEEAP